MVQQSPGNLTTTNELLNAQMQLSTRAENMPRALSTATVAVTGSSALVGFFYSKWDLLLTRLGLAWTTQVEVGHTLTRLGIYVGLFGADWTLVARTDDIGAHTSGVGENLDYPLSATGGYPTSYRIRPDVLYGFAFINVASGTKPAMRGRAGSIQNLMLPAIAKNVSTVTELPTTIHNSDWSTGGVDQPFVYGIP